MPETFATKHLPLAADTLAPDGSAVRVLLALSGGSTAHFRLDPGEISRAGHHQTVEEIWYVIEGCGEMWRKSGAHSEVTPLVPGLCLTIPTGTRFQFRADEDAALAVIAITMPPWPDDVDGEWTEVPPFWPVSL